MKYYNLWIIISIISINILIAKEIKYVSEIVFIGNSIIMESELKSLIKLQSQKLFIRILFSQKKLNKDKI